jgi:hypothetical protein
MNAEAWCLCVCVCVCVRARAYCTVRRRFNAAWSMAIEFLARSLQFLLC